MLTVLLLGGVLGSTPDVVAEPEERTTAVFVAPLTVVTGALFAPVSHSSAIVYVSLGANFTAADIDWAFDVAVMQMDANTRARPVGPVGPPSFAQSGFAGGWLAMGPIFQTGEALDGFFINPKFTLGVFFAGRDTMMVNALVGGDVGYQLTVGRVYLAFLVGASLGVGWGDNDSMAGPMLGINVSVAAPQVGVAIGLNLQLLRIGFAF